MSLNTAAIKESTEISSSINYQGFLISCIFNSFSTKKHVWVITASSRRFMIQPAWAHNFFSPLLPHHLLFPHLFPQPPHLPWSLLHPSLILPSSSPTTGSSGSAPLHLHSAQVPRCTGILRFVHPHCSDSPLHHTAVVFFHTATTESQLHEQGQ